MSTDLKVALNEHSKLFGVDPDLIQIDRLTAYYDLITEHNPILHLVGPSTPDEFATRHILESLTLLKHLPQNAKFIDVGAGAGLPSIPCLIAREDLTAVLIESKEKKASFLNEAIETLGLKKRATVINRQYLEADPGTSGFVTCRAIDKFTQTLPKLINWSAPRTMLLFGGPTLEAALKENRVRFSSELMPLSRERYLFVSRRA